jgi:hypothetical protein
VFIVLYWYGSGSLALAVDPDSFLTFLTCGPHIALSVSVVDLACLFRIKISVTDSG